MENRKYLPTLNELIDRLSIHQLKEVFIPENKENYAKEIKGIQMGSTGFKSMQRDSKGFK